MIGTRFLEIYKVTRLLGEGAMGSVYVAESNERDRIVVKVMQPQLAARQDMVKRFALEAKAAAEIRHPNVVRILGSGKHADGFHFIALEFLEGKTLTDHMTSWGPLSADRAFPILIQICAGLQAAHGRGVVHRDMKPDNVFVCDYPTKGLIKILDFGIAKLMVDSLGMTHSGMVMGTPSYMAPEQASRPRDVDSRADIFAMAVIFFELLTGRRPYPADSFAGLLDGYAQIGAGRSAHPRLAEAATGRDDIPEPWFEAIDRALSVGPGARQSTIRDFIKPIYESFDRGSEIVAALAPSLLEAASPADRTSRAPVAPPAGGIVANGDSADRQTLTGRNTAPPAMFGLTTLHSATGSLDASTSTRRSRLLPSAFLALAGLGAAGALVYAVAIRPSSGGSTLQPSAIARPATIVLDASVEAPAAVVAPVAAAPVVAPGAFVAPPPSSEVGTLRPSPSKLKNKHAREPKTGSIRSIPLPDSRPLPGSGSASVIGDDSSDIFQ